MEILVDLDGIVGDFVGSFLQHYKRRVPENKEVQRMTLRDATRHWNSEKSFPDPKDAMRCMVSLCRTASFWTNMPLLARNAPTLIRNWQSDGHKVMFISTPWDSANSYSGKYRFVAKHFPSMTRNIHLTWHKERIPGDVLIDDKPKTLHAWSANHPSGRTATIKYPYHSAELPPNSTYLAPSFAEPDVAWQLIYDYVNEGA